MACETMNLEVGDMMIIVDSCIPKKNCFFSITGIYFEAGMEKLEKRWNVCITLEESYDE